MGSEAEPYKVSRRTSQERWSIEFEQAALRRPSSVRGIMNRQYVIGILLTKYLTEESQKILE